MQLQAQGLFEHCVALFRSSLAVTNVVERLIQVRGILSRMEGGREEESGREGGR
jgi:hypothetical protein